MDKFDIYLESTGSMDDFSENTMADLGNILAHPIQMEANWRVVLVEMILTRVSKMLLLEILQYTLNMPFKTINGGDDG